MADLTAARLRGLIDYDPATGVFRWKPRPGRQGSWCNVDREPGYVSGQSGYRTIRVDKKLYQAHRLAWLYVYGQWPTQDIDHINGERLDNRIANLRDVPNRLNRQNTLRARKDSRTGVQGVQRHTASGRYQAKIRKDGRNFFLGIFDTIEQAHRAYLDAKAQLHEAWAGERPSTFTDNHLLNASGLRRVRCDSKAGLQGVQRHTDGRWRARIRVGGRTKHIGLFSTPEAAHAAFLNAKLALGS